MSREEGEKMAKENDLFFMEVSAKTNIGNCVNEAFLRFITEIMRVQQRLYDYEGQENGVRGERLALAP